MYSLVIGIILFSFAIPIIVTHIEQKKIFSGNYVLNNHYIQKSNESQANIALVNVIYSIYSNSQKYNVEVLDMNQKVSNIVMTKDNAIIISDKTKILNKIEELVNYQIIDNRFFEDLLKEDSIIYRIWDYDNGEVLYSKIKIFTSENSFTEAIASIEIEKTTNKSIAFAFKKEYVNADKTNLENYVKYLELDMVQDWKYTNKEWNSKELGLKITSSQENEKVYIKLLPKD